MMQNDWDDGSEWSRPREEAASTKSSYNSNGRKGRASWDTTTDVEVEVDSFLSGDRWSSGGDETLQTMNMTTTTSNSLPSSYNSLPNGDRRPSYNSLPPGT